MSPTVLDRASEQISENINKAVRATSNVGDVLRERLDNAKVVARRSAHRAEKIFDEGKTHIKRHPVAAVFGSFLLGLSIGTVVGWTLRRK
jgi:hypothetical protein